METTPRSHPRTLGLVAAVALVLGACGGGGPDVAADPQQAVLDAFEAMGDFEGLSMSLRVEGDPPSLVAASEGDVSEEQARTILESSLQVSATSGTDLADTADDEVRFALRIGDIEAFELRVIGTEGYVRADVRALLERFDATGDAQSGLQQVQALAQQAGLGFVEQAIDGAWLHLVGLDRLQSMMQGAAGGQQPDEAELERARSELASTFRTFLEEDVEYTYVGSEDAGEHVQLTASGEALINLMEQAVEVLEPLTATAGGVDAREGIEELRREVGGDAAAFRVPVEVWLRDGTVARVGLDPVAAARLNDAGDDVPSGVERLLLVADLEAFRGGLEPPPDAIEVDLFEVFGRLMGGMGEFPGGGGGG